MDPMSPDRRDTYRTPAGAEIGAARLRREAAEQAAVQAAWDTPTPPQADSLLGRAMSGRPLDDTEKRRLHAYARHLGQRDVFTAAAARWLSLYGDLPIGYRLPPADDIVG